MNESSAEVEYDILSRSSTGYKKTYPVSFSGRRWWLTEEELNHYLLIQQYFPSDWETEVLKRMDAWELGHPEQDCYLKLRIEQSTKQS